MATTAKTSDHPGLHVRQTIIPPDMSVKDAATLLGIGRSALSNFLNGKAALSPQMATRLEKTFNADAKKLLDMQAAYDRQLRHEDEKRVAVRAFVPSFLNIKARQIEAWANRLDARDHLPVLLRILVQSTGDELCRVDFPGYDNAQRRGSDGFVEAGAANPWIPAGKSYWEFGTNHNPSDKANKDYIARCTSIDIDERSNGTLVFVTPRNWPGKNAWEKEKNETGDWKSVRVYDASDLEQWLEQSVPGQIWLAEQLELPTNGYETLERVWQRWADASEPHLTPEFFAPSIAAHRDTIKMWLEKPSKEPFSIAADSQDEALAFLACLFNDEKLRDFKDLATVFSSSTTLRSLLASSAPLIPIVCSEEAERELADVYQRFHCITFQPRNAVNVTADIALDLLDYGAFKKALDSMGFKEDEAEKLARESGYSPTILRRRLSKIAGIRVPAWASNSELAKALVPMTLIGAWHTGTEADRRIASVVANREYEMIENEIAQLLRLDDSPVWSTGSYLGVVSKIDCLFAIAGMISTADINRFFDAAESVLSETDPALDLPEEKRWAAVLYGKKRNFSNALRDGICETLVILSVHGNSLLQDRLGIDIESRVTVLIRKLLTPLTLEKLLSNNNNLPSYAEAAPSEVLKIIEADMRQSNPIVKKLLKPVDRNSFGVSPPRTGLLWALEYLAWKPENLPRVSVLLAMLACEQIDDNWANKPEASLQAIFRSWMPQTAASVEQRFKVLDMLAKRFPEIAWEICIEQITPGSKFGHDSYRPRWRSDALGVGRVVTRQEMYGFNQKVLDLILAWPTYNEKSLGDLVGLIQSVPEQVESKIWELIDEWSHDADEAAKATLRERIRLFAFTRKGRRRKLGESTRDCAREAYDKLQPRDSIIRHSWLFTDHWVQESGDEIEDEDLDYQKRERRIDKLRRDAMREIWIKHDFNGIIKLLASSNAADTIGRYVASCVTDTASQVDFIGSCLSVEGDFRINAEHCLRGFLQAIEDDARVTVLQTAAERISATNCERLFSCAPFCSATWRLLDAYDEDIRAGYWKNVMPLGRQYTSDELTELVDCLLIARRPRAAFYAVHMDLEDVEVSHLKRLLCDIATVDEESSDPFKLDRYYISKALDILDGCASVTSEEMAQLEYYFAVLLEDSEHGIPNLESQIAQSPALFVQLAARLYKRNDGGEDPPEWRIEDPNNREAVASATYHFLNQLKKIPSIDKCGRIDVVVLIDWLTEARRLFREYGRIDVGDICLGQLLANAPADENGMWPCKAICEAMEEISSSQMGRGFHTGAYNSRGVHSREAGGKQERELSAKYRTWATNRRFDYPFMGGVLDDIAAAYEWDANREDSEDKLEKRLRC